MASRLKQLPSRLGTLPSRVGRPPDLSRDAARDQSQRWRAWYKTRRWKALRWSCLLRDLFTCQRAGCGRVEADTSQLVADHKVPHRGDEALFWDIGNLQTLCKPCHDGAKQTEERAARLGRVPGRAGRG